MLTKLLLCECCRTVTFVRLALKDVIQNNGDLMEVILLLLLYHQYDGPYICIFIVIRLMCSIRH